MANKVGIRFLIVIIALSVFSNLIAGCAYLQETGRKLWGSSTQALEKARVDAEIQTFRCSLSECFDTVSAILEEIDAVIFKQDRKVGCIVAINFEGAVDTTEVGIFFESKGNNITAVEITCLSHWLQEAIAPLIFSKLKESFPVVTK